MTASAARCVLLLLLTSYAVGNNELVQPESREDPQKQQLQLQQEQQVEVFKCCRDNEDLEKPSQNSSLEISPKCVSSGEPWSPLIYSIEEGNYVELPELWRIHKGRRPVCDHGKTLTYVPVTKIGSNVVILDYGYVILEPSGSNVELKPGEFCLGTSSMLVCIEQKTPSRQAAATMKPKVWRCCGENALYDKRSCAETDDNEGDGYFLHNVTRGSMEIAVGFPSCPNDNNFTIIGDMKDSEIQPDGSLKIGTAHVPSENFCIERTKEQGQKVKPFKIFACSEHAVKGSALPPRDIRFTLYPVGFIISAIFLAATLAAGWLLPASHHVLHWRCQTHHVACLMLGDIFMAVIQLAGNSLQGEPCRIIAILAHFFFLATFFWLNTMCFNIWWTFRDLRPASLEKGQELIRLRFYSAYGWGGPFIVAGLAAFVDHLQPTPGQTFLRPRFGEKQCWFYGDIEILAYFYGPLGVLLAINLLFFAATARELTCGLWKGEFVKSTTERAALGKVCLKLVVVMGVPWIFDVISWLLPSLNFLWYVTDLLNAVQGVFIFMVVGCQPQVRAALKKRLWSKNPRTNTGRQGNGLSTTSHGMPSINDSVTPNPSTKTAPLETIC